MQGIDLDAELAALSGMTLAQMRVRWAVLTGRPVPRVRRTLLRLALGEGGIRNLGTVALTRA